MVSPGSFSGRREKDKQRREEHCCRNHGNDKCPPAGRCFKCASKQARANVRTPAAPRCEPLRFRRSRSEPISKPAPIAIAKTIAECVGMDTRIPGSFYSNNTLTCGNHSPGAVQGAEPLASVVTRTAVNAKVFWIPFAACDRAHRPM